MPTQYFLHQRKIGHHFEKLICSLLEARGFRTLRNPSRSYYDKRKYDLKAWNDEMTFCAETKVDLMSADTGNVCIDISSLSHSNSQLFFLGVATAPKLIDIYLASLKYTLEYAQKHPSKKMVGENHWVESAIIPKSEFTSLPFVELFAGNVAFEPPKERVSISKALKVFVGAEVVN